VTLKTQVSEGHPLSSIYLKRDLISLSYLQEEEFQRLSEAANKELQHPRVVSYLKQTFFPFAEMWANYGRKFFHENCETNNLVERY